MATNQYFDETKIIKKNKKTDTKDNQQQTTPEENIVVKEETTIENKEIQPQIDMEEIDSKEQTSKNEKIKKYIETVQEIQNDEKKDIPVYSVSRDENKNVVVTPKNKKKKVEVIQKEKKEDNVTIFNEQYERIKLENERKLQSTRVEILVYTNLIKNEPNPDQRKIFNTRLDTLMNDLQFLNKRKNILEDDQLWLKD